MICRSAPLPDLPLVLRGCQPAPLIPFYSNGYGPTPRFGGTELRPLEDAVHRPDRLLLYVRENVTVGVECDRDGRMPQKLLDHLGMYTSGEEQGRAGVPEVV